MRRQVRGDDVVLLISGGSMEEGDGRKLNGYREIEVQVRALTRPI